MKKFAIIVLIAVITMLFAACAGIKTPDGKTSDGEDIPVESERSSIEQPAEEETSSDGKIILPPDVFD